MELNELKGRHVFVYSCAFEEQAAFDVRYSLSQIAALEPFRIAL